MNENFLTISELANKLSVSTRTLRYYDKIGLLSPAHYNNSGYRMYRYNDLTKLQYILSLKFLGFSLNEIKAFVYENEENLSRILKNQKAMLKEKGLQIDAIINAIDETEVLLKTSDDPCDSIIKVINAVQLSKKTNWLNTYLSSEQRKYIKTLVEASYSKKSLCKFKTMNSNENFRKDQISNYKLFRTKLKDLVLTNEDPSSDKSQELGSLLHNINLNRSMGDTDTLKEMKSCYDNYTSSKDSIDPLNYKISSEEMCFLKEVMRFFYKKSTLTSKSLENTALLQGGNTQFTTNLLLTESL